ncbi:MAG: 1-phosphofructokinase family hexose kinase [Oscillospiraceae bacterium]|nr:1-phosphofructokinase family hexose kinase [Oscillospiraceae bacterium]
MSRRGKVVTVTLNPAFDVTIHIGTLSFDAVNRVMRETREAAGTGVNIALALKVLGADSSAAGLAGEENIGSFVCMLEQKGLCADFVPVTGSVRENLTILSEGETIKINRSGPRCSPTALDLLLEKLRGLFSAGDIAVFGGSMPNGMDKPLFLSLVRHCSDIGYKIALDTDVLTAEEICSLRPWLIKPNIHELGMMTSRSFQSEEEMIAACRGFAECGVGIVLLSMGSDGLAAVTADTVVIARPPEVAAVNTVGAGDSTLAGFISRILLEKPLSEAVMYAAACGAAAILTEASVIESTDKISEILQNTEITEL